MKKASIITRLETLEALPPKTDTEADRKLAAAISALFDLVKQPSDMDALWHRIKTKTTTEVDQAMMNAWPKCDHEPEWLVECVMRVRDKF